MVSEENFEFNEIYEPVFSTKARYIDIWGGRAAGRSHFGTDYFLYLITDPQYFRGCFLRNVYGDIRDSLFQDFKDRIENSCFNEEDFEINDTKMTIRYKPTGNTIISKGFKKSSGNRSAKLKSLAGLTHVLIEEADENSENDVNKLDDSIRTNRIDNIQIIFLHNPPSKNHWLIKRFYHLEDCGIFDEDGKQKPYYRAIPIDHPDFLSIHSTFRDNLKNLNKKTVQKYMAYGDPDSPFYDEDMYYVDVLGLVPEGARGRIYRNWKRIPDSLFLSLPYESYYGLDFGYSDDPVALVEIKSHNNRNFYRERIYETGLTNPNLAEKMKALNIPKKARIYADSAEPKSIKELRDLGFNVLPGQKGPDSVLFGIKALQGMENFISAGSKNLWSENEEYKWQVDSNGEPTNTPVDKHNHCFTGDTLIETKDGLVRIDSVEPGQFALTRKGYRKVLKRFDNGNKEVWRIVINFKKRQKVVLQCTPTHKIFTKEKGWIQVASLQPGMTVILSRNSMANDSICTKTKDIFLEEQQGYTELFMNTSLEKSLKGTISIIKTKTRITTILQTLKSFLAESICPFIPNKGWMQIQNSLKGFRKKLLWRLQRGTDQQKEENGTEIMLALRQLGYTRETSINVAKNAETNIKQLSPQKTLQDSARTDASSDGEQKKIRKKSWFSVLYAAARSLLTNTRQQTHAVLDVVESIEVQNLQQKRVYDLMIEGQHEYFANGILVHNCKDAIRLGVTTHRELKKKKKINVGNPGPTEQTRMEQLKSKLDWVK